ncbi:TIGR02594 family protein [Rhizobium sp. S163]|uniref:NlpC/P60 family protein n=1 Tax=Rhizobium sp. S163 TaxID=3055039 RepID=UPI0025A94774|nr:TIGR02594 family protein [Rhizobium sp. S163]MDM9647731.1 TIGR02594 family protein [Rhizobium sp. S163]
MTSFELWLNTRLRVHGAYDGVVDGVYGRASMEALIRFQKAEGLPATGRADTATVAALRVEPRGSVVKVVPAPVIPAEPVWMREARRFVGLLEIPGPKSNSTIIGWAKALGGWIATFFTNDDTPWCGLFMAHCFGFTLPQEKLPANPLGALEWNKFGAQLTSPVLGAVLVFKRPGGGHVGLYVGEDDQNYIVLGGNQSNSVKLSLVEKARCVGIRWPKTGSSPIGGIIRSTLEDEVSRNEA